MLAAFLTILLAIPSPIWRQSGTDTNVELCVRPSYCENGVCYSEVILGGYSHEHGIYRSWTGDRWGDIASPPIAIQSRAKNFGVTQGKAKPAYSINGRVASREEAIAAVLHDDSKLPHITIIDKNHAEIVKQLDSLKATNRVQGYPPDHWAVKSLAPLGGVVYQSPDGKVLGKLDKYTDLASVTAMLSPTPSAPTIGVGAILAILLGLFLWRRHAAAQ